MRHSSIPSVQAMAIGLVWVMCVSACTVSLVDMTTKTSAYQRKIPALPNIAQQSFDSQQAAGAAATLQNVVAAKMYYNGCPALSKDAETLYMLSYRFMGLCGVNMDFDPNDPKSVEEVFKKMDNSVKEKDQKIHEQQAQIIAMTQSLAKKEDIIRDKGKELEGVKVSHAATIGNIIWIASGIALAILGLLIFGQVMTGIPFPKLAFQCLTLGIGKVYKFGHQTGEAIMEWKKDRDLDIKENETRIAELESRAPITPEDTEADKLEYSRRMGLLEGLRKGREELSYLLGVKQDKDVKGLVKSLFKKGITHIS